LCKFSVCISLPPDITHWICPFNVTRNVMWLSYELLLSNDRQRNNIIQNQILEWKDKFFSENTIRSWQTYPQRISAIWCPVMQTARGSMGFKNKRNG
jgi:hypothetical protein